MTKTKENRTLSSKVLTLLSCLLLFAASACDETYVENETVDISTSRLALSEELVENGDFSDGDNNWYLGQYGGTSSGSVTGGEYIIAVTSAGSEWWHAQFQQGDIPLVQGTTYTFSFDAYKGPENSGTQIMQINVGEDGGDYTSYFTGQNQEITLTNTPTHYSYTFEMVDSSDPAARVEFNCGQYTGTYYIDNVSVKEIVLDEAHLTASPGTLDLGDVAVNSTESIEITLTNDGGMATQITSVSVNNGLFTHDAPGTFTVDSLGSATFNVSFSPTATGNVSGTLTIESNAADNPSIVIPLSAVGVSAGLEVLPLSFALTAGVNETVTETLTLTNTSSSAVTWSITSGQSWLSAAPTSGTIQGGGAANVSVTANASGLSGGTYSGTIQITHNASNIASPYGIPVVLEVTEGYQPQCAYLIDPSLAIQFVEDVAAFRINARDNQNGGFYTFVDGQGNPTGENTKSLNGQSRLGYTFVRAFMLTGNETYLDHAHHALKFLYDHGFDDGWYFVTDIQGNYIDHWGHTDWWSFQQHYALLGITAMVEATGGDIDWGDGSQTDNYWLNTGVNSNYSKLWDTSAASGYFEWASRDWGSKWGKGFTPTVDGITTHAHALAAMTDDPQHDARLFQLADNIVDHMVGSMSISALGFPEYFDSAWNVDYGAASADIGHHYKTSWVLQRAFLMDTSRTAYNDAAQEIMWDLWDGDAYDKTHGGPYSTVQWQDGTITSTNKNHWMVEQGVTAGLINYYVATEQSDKDMYLEVADGSLAFMMDHMVDETYGDTYSDVSADGNSVVNGDKGGLFTAGYHSVELGYYVYLYANLYYHNAPVTLYYYYPTDSSSRSYRLTPLAIEDEVLKILSIEDDGAAYSNFDADSRTLTLPPGVGGVFAVTFGTQSSCGDNVCSGGETCATCEADCGPCGYCGDGACNDGETCNTCETDCGPCEYCGDGVCNNGETCSTCEMDCGACEEGTPIPARIEAEDYDRANETSSPNNNEGGACDRGDGVDMEQTGDTQGGNCNVGWTATGEWLEFDLDAGDGGIFDVVNRVATDSTNSAFTLSIDGQTISGQLSVPQNGWQVYTDITVSDISLSAGIHVLRITFTGYVNLNWIDINAVGPCVPTTCALEGAECGIIDDGCEGTLNCGTCSTGEICSTSNLCEPEETCGNGTCGAGENCANCEVDCGPCETCGDGICNNQETCDSCETDCGPCEFCGDGICNNGETCDSCEADCGSCNQGNCTCPSGCDSVINESVELVVDGADDTCYFIDNLGSSINSWNTVEVNINGVDITNAYMGSWSYPSEIDGGYYIYLHSTVPWAHLEVK